MKYRRFLRAGILLTVIPVTLAVGMFLFEEEAQPNTTISSVPLTELLVLAIPLILVFLLGVFFLVLRFIKIRNEE